MIEEAYEAVAAIEAGDDAELAEELGDVLLQVVLHAQIASEDGRFDIDDVARGITAKIVHRHPHIFGDGRGRHTRRGPRELGQHQARREGGAGPRHARRDSRTRCPRSC